MSYTFISVYKKGFCGENFIRTGDKRTKMKRKSRYLLSILLCVCVMVACLPVAGLAVSTNQYADMRTEEYWSYNALKTAVESGLLQGDERGRLIRPPI
jgi:hypothetical protein